MKTPLCFLRRTLILKRTLRRFFTVTCIVFGLAASLTGVGLAQAAPVMVLPGGAAAYTFMLSGPTGSGSGSGGASPPTGFGCWLVKFDVVSSGTTSGTTLGTRVLHGRGTVLPGGFAYTGDLRHITWPVIGNPPSGQSNCTRDYRPGFCTWDHASPSTGWVGNSVSVSGLPILSAQAIACS